MATISIDAKIKFDNGAVMAVSSVGSRYPEDDPSKAGAYVSEIFVDALAKVSGSTSAALAEKDREISKLRAQVADLQQKAQAQVVEPKRSKFLSKGE